MMFDILFQVKDSVLSRTARDTSVIFLGNAISLVFGTIFTILAARFLGPEGWGTVAAVIGFIGILVAFGDLGLTSGLFRFVSRLRSKGEIQKARKMQDVIFTLRVISSLVLSVVLLTLSPWIASLIFKVNNPLLAIFGAIGLFGSLLMDFQITSFQAKLHWKRAAFFITLTNTIRVAFLLVLFLLSKLNILSLVFVFFISPLLAFFSSLYWERPELRFRGRWGEVLKEVAGFSSWMGVNRIVGATSSRINVLLLLHLTTSFETGIFAAANQIANTILVFVASFATVIAPRFASYEGEDLKKFFRKTILLSATISIGIVAGILLAKPVIALFGPDYESSIGVFKGLLLALVPFALATPAVNGLIYSFHKPKIIAILSLIQLPLVFLGNIYLIPIMGVFGPVLVLGLWNLSTLFVSYSFAWYYFKK